MAILTLVYQLLYNENCSQPGTLYTEKIRLNRLRANGNDVKNHYDDCRELFVSVVDAYIVEAACDHFGIAKLDELPTKNIPADFTSLPDVEKYNMISSEIGILIDKFVWPHNKGKMVNVSNDTFNQIMVTLPDGKKKIFLVPCITESQVTCKSAGDGLKTYGKNVLELGLLFKNLTDAISTPNLERIKPILKYAMLILKGHNNLSKYALEILRYLFQLYESTEKEANEMFYGQFVNTQGKVNSFIPADLQMEYLVKLTKSHIRAVSANKTEGVIKKRKIAFAGITRITDNFDSKTKPVVRAHKHKIPSSHDDELLIIKTLRGVHPFEERGRQLTGHRMAHSPILKLNKNHLYGWIKEHQIDFQFEY